MTKKRGDQDETTNRFRKEVDNHLRKIGMHLDELLAYFKLSDKYFRGAKNNFPENLKEQKPFTLDFVRQMVLACNIDPKVFLLNEAELKNWERIKKPGDNLKRYYQGDQIQTKWGLQQTLREVLDLEYRPGDIIRKKSFARRYIKAVRPYFEMATKSILVSEFLGKGSFDEPGLVMDAYQMAHLAIFRDIEAQLEKEDQLHYQRILRLPADYYYGRQQLSERIVEAIKHCSLPTFQHIFKCLHRFNSRVTFCIAPVSQPMHFGLIEGESKIILSEQYKYIHNDHIPNSDILIPATLFIEECPPGPNPLNTIWNMYKRDINECMVHKSLYLTKNNIKALTKIAQEEINRGAYTKMDEEEAHIVDTLEENIEAKVKFMNGN